MEIDRQAFVALRVFLVALFALLVVFQAMSLPGQFAHMAEENPEDAYMRWPLTAITVFWAVCAQVVIASTWKLLGLVQTDRIFTAESGRWVDAMVRAIAAGWVTLAGLTTYVMAVADDPGVPMLLTLLTIAVGAAGLLMNVMRTLLRRASLLRADLEAVI